MRTSVEIALQDSASGPAKRIATEFDAIGRSADGINSALDPKGLEDYNRQLTQIGEKYAQLKNTEKSFQQQQVSHARQIQGLASGVGTGVAQLGAGNVGGAAMSAGGGLSGLASMLGGPAALIGGLGLAGGLAGNALANQYEQRSGPAGRIAALSGGYGTDLKSNTMALREAMTSTTDAVARYGKTFEEGVQAQEMYLKAGGRDFSGSRAGAYSMAYGANFGNLAAFEGLGARYGQGGGLDVANTIRRQQGLSPAMLEEVMGGIQGSFTQALSQGVIRSMSGIGRSQEFFSRAGATWQGGLGAQRVQGLDQALAGAGGLQSQSDMFLYRAAAKLSGGDMLETKKLMEQGMSPEMFKGLMSEFDRFGYGKTESVLQLSKMFGLSTTAAEEMYNLGGQTPGTGRGGGLPTGTGTTVESKYIGDVQNIIDAIARGLGAPSFDARAALVGGGTDKIMQMFKEFGNSAVADVIHTKTIQAASIQISENFSTDAFGAEVYNPAKSLAGVRSGYSELIKLIDDARTGGASETALYGSIRGAYKDVTARSGEGGVDITVSELENISEILREVVAAIREDVIIEDATYGQPVGGFTQ